MGTSSLRLEGRLEMQQWRRTLRQHKLAFMKCVCPIHCNRRIPFTNHYGNPTDSGSVYHCEIVHNGMRLYDMFSRRDGDWTTDFAVREETRSQVFSYGEMTG